MHYGKFIFKTWKQGVDAVKMFRRYGTQTPIVPNSPLMERISTYVPEARERYGLIGNTDITDAEIAGSLYKKAMSLSKKGNAAVNEYGEPLLLFRGDTQRYQSFRPSLSPEELAKKRGSMDNAFGTLFLGNFGKEEEGVERYINYVLERPGGYRVLRPSATGDKVVFNGIRMNTDFDERAIILPQQAISYDIKPMQYRSRIPTRIRKVSPYVVESGVNDINAFVVNANKVRDATMEISPEMGGQFIMLEGKPRFLNGEEADRMTIANKINEMLRKAKQNSEGLFCQKRTLR